MYEMEKCEECGTLKGVTQDCPSSHCAANRAELTFDWDERSDGYGMDPE